jgi:hypothetical protein
MSHFKPKRTGDKKMRVRQTLTFFWGRGFSVLMDETWSFSLPVIIASTFSNPTLLAACLTAKSTGDILGFVFLSTKGTEYRSGTLTVAADIFQVIAMIGFFLAFLIGNPDPIVLVGLSFVTGAAGAIWFVSSDALAGKVISKDETQLYHKYYAIAQSLAPLLGPLLATQLLAAVGVLAVISLNGFSFAAQIFSATTMRKNEVYQPTKSKFFERIAQSIIYFKKNKSLQSILYLSLINKVFLGFLPFIAYLMVKSNFAGHLAAIPLTSFGFAVWVSSVLYRPTENQKVIPNLFRVSVIQFLIAQFTIYLSLNLYQMWDVIVLTLFSALYGYLLGRYQILIRSARQIYVDPSEQTQQFALLGLLARTTSPFAIVLFGFILNNQSRSELVTWSLGALFIVSFSFLFLIWKNQNHEAVG